MSAIEDTAVRLRAAYAPGTPIAPIRDGFKDGDLESAYAIQTANHRYWLGQGRRLVGRKIGLTAKAMQKAWGVDHPMYGLMYADVDMSDGEIDMARFNQPRLEAEIALVLGRDLTLPRLTLAEIISAVDYAVAAFEIADSRIADWKFGMVDIIADNGANGGFVIGSNPRRITDVDLCACSMTMYKNGAVAAMGTAAATVGNPLLALKWLAETSAGTETPLRAGDVILTGSLGAIIPAAAGDVFDSHVLGLGSVRAVVSS